MARGPRPDELDAGAVLSGGVPAGHGRQAAHGRRPRRHEALRRARRGGPGRAVCGGQAGAGRAADRGGPVHGLPGRAAVHPGRQGHGDPGRGSVLVQERSAVPGADPPGHLRRRAAPRLRLPPPTDDARGVVRRRHLRPRLPQGQARPGHLPHRRPGARRRPRRLFRGRGRLQRGAGGQGRQHGGAGGGPSGRPGPAGRGRRRPGRADPRRRLGGRPGRGSPGGAAGGRRAAPAAHRAAAERLDAGLRRLRPRPPGAAGGAVRGRQRLLRDPRGPARGLRRRGPLPGHLRRRPLQPGPDRHRRAHGRERGPGQRPQLAAAPLPHRERALVRRRVGRGAGAPAGAGPAPAAP